jgi:hypothetical protein
VAGQLNRTSQRPGHDVSLVLYLAEGEASTPGRCRRHGHGRLTDRGSRRTRSPPNTSLSSRKSPTRKGSRTFIGPPRSGASHRAAGQPAVLHWRASTAPGHNPVVTIGSEVWRSRLSCRSTPQTGSRLQGPANRSLQRRDPELKGSNVVAARRSTVQSEAHRTMPLFSNR